jgi:putative transposase
MGDGRARVNHDASPSRCSGLTTWLPAALTSLIFVDPQWSATAPMIPDARLGGRSRKVDRREIVDEIPRFLRAGCALRLMPHDLPPSRTVCHPLRSGVRSGAVIDGQTVRTARNKFGFKGFDAGKRMHGRKQHVLTDTGGRLRVVHVHAAVIAALVRRK